MLNQKMITVYYFIASEGALLHLFTDANQLIFIIEESNSKYRATQLPIAYETSPYGSDLLIKPITSEYTSSDVSKLKKQIDKLELQTTIGLDNEKTKTLKTILEKDVSYKKGDYLLNPSRMEYINAMFENHHDLSEIKASIIENATKKPSDRGCLIM